MSSVVEYKENKVTYVPLGNKDQIELSINLVKQFVANPTKSGKMPEKKDVVNFIMMCQAKKLNPFEGDAYLIGFDGQNGPEFSLITAHQAFLKRAEISKEYEGMESGVILLVENNQIIERAGDFFLDSETLVGGWAKVYRSDRKIPTYRRVKLSTFDKGRSRWKTDPGGMIVKCAEADALRSSFPTLLGGLYTENEMPDGDDMPKAMSLEEKIKSRELKDGKTNVGVPGGEPVPESGQDSQPNVRNGDGGGKTQNAGKEEEPDEAPPIESQEDPEVEDKPTKEKEPGKQGDKVEAEPAPPLWPVKIRQAYANAGITDMKAQSELAGEIGIADIRNAGKSAFEAVIKQLAKMEKAGKWDPLDVSEDEVDEFMESDTRDMFDDDGVPETSTKKEQPGLNTPLAEAEEPDKAARKLKYIREKFREAREAMAAEGFDSITEFCEAFNIPGLTTEYVTVHIYNKMVDTISAAKAAHK